MPLSYEFKDVRVSVKASGQSWATNESMNRYFVSMLLMSSVDMLRSEGNGMEVGRMLMKKGGRKWRQKKGKVPNLYHVCKLGNFWVPSPLFET